MPQETGWFVADTLAAAQVLKVVGFLVTLQEVVVGQVCIGLALSVQY